jgi:predicted nucleic acid-binding protein
MPFARQFQITVYNAVYLDLAMRKGMPIASLDKRLGAAASAAKVPLLE